jgi:hypothetical protein
MVSKAPHRAGVKLAGWGMTGLRHPASQGGASRLGKRAGTPFCMADGIAIPRFAVAVGPRTRTF